jgi:hypothetical protein
MKIGDDQYEMIHIGTIVVQQLIFEAHATIPEKSMTEIEYCSIAKQLVN